ncbi:hypothetical protein [Qipengyuania sp. 902]|uniref:hypothetical protein n=1 Tax=Qipengyuania sp. 902 TaxID=3417565 RepID=UPI003EB7519F
MVTATSDWSSILLTLWTFRRTPVRNQLSGISMNIELERGSTRDERRACAKALLARYPDLPSDQRDDLLRWFRKEASALDVGLISMDDEVSQRYALLKRNELDRFAMPDIVFMLLFWSAMCAIIGGIGYLGS